MNMVEKYTEIDGVSGSEDLVADAFISDIIEYVDEVEALPLGGVIGTIHGTSGNSIMVAAHMDEVGVMISHITKDGFAYFVPIGGLNADTIIGQEVRFGDEYGVIGSVPPHLRDDKSPTPKLEDLWIDFGVTSIDDLVVEIGDVGVFPSTFRNIGDKIMAKALDDRAGLAAIVESLEHIENPVNTLYLVASTQEEVGLKGVRGAIERKKPDVAIAIDVTMCHDTPGVPKKKAPVKQGDGPVLVIADGAGRGIISDRELNKHIRREAEDVKIPLQVEVSSGGTTDATMMQLVGEGRKATTLSIPTDYIHSPRSTMNMKDYDNLVKLLNVIYDMEV